MSARLAYFADPMCSWCYGFGPELDRLLDALGEPEIALVMGGLRAYNTQVMDASLKATLKQHWRHVHEASGLPFDESLLARDDFVYDTEPACRAVATARALDGAAALEMFRAIQRAFYGEGYDVTRGDVLADVAADVGFDGEEFLAAWQSDAMREATAQDFRTAREAGITGFPTLCLEREGQLYLLSAGYLKADTLIERARQLLEMKTN